MGQLPTLAFHDKVHAVLSSLRHYPKSPGAVIQKKPKKPKKASISCFETNDAVITDNESLTGTEALFAHRCFIDQSVNQCILLISTKYEEFEKLVDGLGLDWLIPTSLAVS